MVLSVFLIENLSIKFVFGGLFTGREMFFAPALVMLCRGFFVVGHAI